MTRNKNVKNVKRVFLKNLLNNYFLIPEYKIIFPKLIKFKNVNLVISGARVCIYIYIYIVQGNSPAKVGAASVCACWNNCLLLICFDILVWLCTCFV